MDSDGHTDFYIDANEYTYKHSDRHAWGSADEHTNRNIYSGSNVDTDCADADTDGDTDIYADEHTDDYSNSSGV